MTIASIDKVEARVAEIQSRISPTQDQASQGGFADALNAVLGAHAETGSLSTGLLSTGSLSAMATTTTASATSTPASAGNAAVDAAKQYLGVPYVWGGTSDSGLDCSGLVQKAYGDIGIKLPRVAADQAKQGTPVASLAQAKPGDLVAFGSPVDHIGIYAGDNKMIVAPKRGDVVKIEDVYTTPTAIRHIIPEGNNFSISGGSSIGGSSPGGSSIGGSLTSQYNSLFQAAGAKYGIAPNLLAAVAKQESGFNPAAVSSAGAQGLMQFMPGTAKSLGINPLDPAQAIDGAAQMLSGLTDKFGSVQLALAGYNAGPGAVEKYNGIPPYQETQNYVQKVMSLAQQGGPVY